MLVVLVIAYVKGKSTKDCVSFVFLYGAILI